MQENECVEKICPICGLPMKKRKNLIGLPFWRCASDNREHSIRINELVKGEMM